MDDYIVVNCPHCNDSIFIYLKDLNCRIFRHGVFKHNLHNIPPHLSKKECDKLVANNLILGCGKPFLIDASMNSVECGYI